MKAMITMMLVLGSVGVADAYDLGNQSSIKSVVTYPENIPDPERQGGDTIATATVIPTLPYYDSGTTAGYTDNYAGTCLDADGAPGVVYQFMVPTGYVLEVAPLVPCEMPAIPASDEGEPPLFDDYVDEFNGGCSAPNHSFQSLCSESYGGDLTFRGVTGWYRFAGEMCRDMDWFVLFPASNHRDIEIDIDAEQRVTLYELSPTDCATFSVIQMIDAGPCEPSHVTIALHEWSYRWICVAPRWPVPDDPSTFEYLLWISPLWHVATEPVTWGGIKTLFR